MRVAVGAAVAPGVAAVAAGAPSGPARSLLRLCSDAVAAAAEGRVTADGVEGLRAAITTGVRRLQGDASEAPRISERAAEGSATGGVPSDERGGGGKAAVVSVEASGDDASESFDDDAADSGGFHAGVESDDDARDGGAAGGVDPDEEDNRVGPPPTGVLRALAAIVTPSRGWM